MTNREILYALIDYSCEGGKRSQVEFAKKLGIMKQRLAGWLDRDMFDPFLIYERICAEPHDRQACIHAPGDGKGDGKMCPQGPGRCLRGDENPVQNVQNDDLKTPTGSEPKVPRPPTRPPLYPAR